MVSKIFSLDQSPSQLYITHVVQFLKSSYLRSEIQPADEYRKQ